MRTTFTRQTQRERQLAATIRTCGQRNNGEQNETQNRAKGNLHNHVRIKIKCFDLNELYLRQNND